MKLRIGNFERSGERISSKTVSEYSYERQERASGKTYVCIPTLFRKDEIVFKTTDGEIITYYEVFHDNKLQDRYLDYDYKITTPEYQQDYINFCNGNIEEMYFN